MKHTNVKETIQQETTNLIIKNGVKNTSLADIAKSCGISKGTLYYHYSSKDELICDIASIHLKVITDAVIDCIEGIGDNNPDTVMVLILEKIAAIKVRGRIHMYLLCEAMTGNDKLKSQINENYDEWKKTLKSVILTRVDDEKKAEALASLVIAIVDGLVVQSLLKSSKEIPFENIANVLVDKFV